ncbi:hypothetical protein PENSTE_c003G05757 [Penicillium steckii]|uniref:Uncharacterized protein n=1 Tax=Penicillium steckii TaxID=303698 RepID=A0A1V6TRT9_9EURO|nr:hypothetical protein PENSTE_c003G05757 [Penicillium steckii]
MAVSVVVKVALKLFLLS